MKLNNFIKELEKALVERSVSEELSKKHVANLYRSFTSDDLSEIESLESPDEIAALADSIAIILNKNKKDISPSSKEQLKNEDNQPSQLKTNNPPREKSVTFEPIRPVTSNSKENSSLYDKPDYDYIDHHREDNPTTRGITIFWVGLFITLPLSLSLLAIVFGAFAAAFAGLIGIIVGSIAVLIGIVALGAAASLVGIIYGVTQLFSFPAAGIYEIGLGIIVAGAVLLVSILIYNFAIRLIPWVISKLGVFFKYACKKLLALFKFIRKECYKL